MRFFLTVCSRLGIDVRRLRVWLSNLTIRFYYSRTRKIGAFLRLYEDRRPLSHFGPTMWKIRHDRWAVEAAFWTDRTTGMAMLKAAIGEHWARKRHYLWQLREDARIKIAHRRYDLKKFFRLKNLRRRLKRMPTVCVTSHNGLTAVVLRKDLARAKRVFVGYEKDFIVGGNYGAHFVPHRTMIFAKPTAQSFALRKPAAEIATGTPNDMRELLRGCVVETFAKSSFFVPYSSYHHLLEWQREQFPPISLKDAYSLVWKNRRQPPVTAS